MSTEPKKAIVKSVVSSETRRRHNFALAAIAHDIHDNPNSDPTRIRHFWTFYCISTLTNHVHRFISKNDGMLPDVEGVYPSEVMSVWSSVLRCPVIIMCLPLTVKEFNATLLDRS